MMRIAVFGVGGVGGYYGGRLAQSGQDVTFIARGSHLEAIQRDGLRVDSINGDFSVDATRLTATDDPATVGTVDLVVVGVKAWHVPDIAPAIALMTGSETVVLPLQNGVEAPTQLASALGPEAVIGGVCRIMSSIKGPGHIEHTAIDPSVEIGELDGSTTNRVERVRRVFEDAHTRVDVPRSIWASLWNKFVLIAPWGGLGAVSRVPVGLLRGTPETRQLLERAMTEVVALASAHDVDLAPDTVSQTMAIVDAVPANGTASMQRDIVGGRPSELESQNGAIVRLGEKKRVPTPVNRFVYSCLRPQELVARREDGGPGAINP